jgi:hypothetical protein
MKQCPKCNESKSLEDFSKNKRTKDGLQRECKLCAKLRDSISYKKRGKDKYIETQKKFHKRNRTFIEKYKKIYGKCIDCGIKDYRVLQFDHQHNKKYNISEMIHAGNSLNLIKEEIRKCEIRCANCHQIKTYYSL